MEDLFFLSIKALIKNTKGQILVLQKNSAKRSNLNPPHWDLPGGRIRRKDNIEETLIREVREEINIKNIKIETFFDASIAKVRLKSEFGIVGLVLFTYLCSIKENSKITLDEEHISYKWCDKSEAIKLLKIKFSNSFIKKLKNL